MPTRYLKPGIRDSELIESVQSPDAEILYYRLLVSVDDFGRADARPLMIKSLCFPIRMRATADKCAQWLQELDDARLLTIYHVDEKPYLQIAKWDNKPRAEHSKFPEMRADVYNCPQMLPVTVTETVTKTDKHTVFANANGAWDEFWKAYPRKTAKTVALRSWKRVKGIELPALMAALQVQKETDQWRRGVIPHPATWLNQRRWEDVVEAPATTPAALAEDQGCCNIVDGARCGKSGAFGKGKKWHCRECGPL